MRDVDLHHVGQVVHADFADAVAFYEATLGRPPRGTTDGAVRVAFFETPSAELHLIVRESRGSGIDGLLDRLLDRSTAHLAFAVPDLEAAMTDATDRGLSFLGDPPEEGLGPYRRAFVDPDHLGVPFEFVEP